MNKEFFKDLMDLKKAVFVPKFAAQLKQYNKLIYYVGLFFVFFFLLQSLITLIHGAISMAILELAWAFISFIILRMFCEFLMDFQGRSGK